MLRMTPNGDAVRMWSSIVLATALAVALAFFYNTAILALVIDIIIAAL
ncbi:MAG: hypothetical protein ACRDSJ_00525 [Rubrobacteraceae bacterium]